MHAVSTSPLVILEPLAKQAVREQVTVKAEWPGFQGQMLAFRAQDNLVSAKCRDDQSAVVQINLPREEGDKRISVALADDEDVHTSEKSVITNVHLENVKMVAPVELDCGANQVHAAALVAHSQGRVERCSATGKVTGNYPVGGLVAIRSGAKPIGQRPSCRIPGPHRWTRGTPPSGHSPPHGSRS